MAVVLEIDTKKNLFRPIEIKVDGKLFKVRTITLGNLEIVQKLQRDAAAGSAVAIRKMLGAILEGPLDMLVNLTIEQLGQVIEAAVSKSIEPEVGEKNGQGPGQDKLPS